MQTQPTTPSPYATREEAAAFLRLSARTLDKLIASGTIPAVRLGRRVLIRHAVLENLEAAAVLIPESQVDPKQLAS